MTDDCLKKIGRGDQSAFKEFYHLQFFKLYQFAYSYVHCKEPAEEIVNDVFLALWQKRESLGSIENIQVYLYVCVKNACLNYLRRNDLPVPLSVDELSVDHLQLIADAVIQKELQRQIREAIEQLPPRCRLVFKLIKEDGLSYKQVASILDISVKTVDNQLYLALKKLAVLLQEIHA
jgi:RNA polymerase sigma-70 factor (ECF subfamily)